MKPTLIMMVGLPASGKSMYAKKLSEERNCLVVSTDAVRLELFGNEECQDDNTKVYKIVHERILQLLKQGDSVIYDATNINYKKRMAFLELIKKIDCVKQCCFIVTPYEDCLKYNAERARRVPIEVIERMYKNFYIPQYYEGWDDVQIIQNCDTGLDAVELFQGKNGLNFFSQNNSNHELTVGEHCLECARNVFDISKERGIELSYSLWQAAFFHDIGKPFVKTFTNSKGEITTNAHYYQHHMVSAYNSLFYTSKSNALEVANYIQWHMQPYFMEKEKTHEKYKQLWGADFYNNLMILNAADRKAKKRDEFDTLIKE